MAHDDNDDDPGSRHIVAVDDLRPRGGLSFLLWTDRQHDLLWRILSTVDDPEDFAAWVWIVGKSRTTRMNEATRVVRSRWTDSVAARIAAAAALIAILDQVAHEIAHLVGH